MSSLARNYIYNPKKLKYETISIISLLNIIFEQTGCDPKNTITWVLVLIFSSNNFVKFSHLI
jgi:hypothetical protein